MNEQNIIPVQNVDVTGYSKPVPEKQKPAQQKSKIYIRAVKGRIETFRRIFGLLFIGAFVLIPWLPYQGQQAVLFDFVAQRFHLFGLTLWPQDLTLLAWLFMLAAFALFVVTSIAGRVWCGFMCPQTVFTFLFVWVEQKLEGSRNKRILLDKEAWTLKKWLTKISKHSIWLFIALLTSMTFVGYFFPIKELFSGFVRWDLTFWPLFYIALFTFCTYANAGWMREIMCTHMCPYARFQSSMFDQDTYTVTYDKARGESRGPRGKKLSEPQRKERGLGDCIDCQLCVQVCPTGIDIRNGLQYECINCGACVDACNDVMGKMNYQQGLIRFASESEFKGNKPTILRPKVLGYLAVLLVMTGLFGLDLYYRPSLDADIVRDRHALHRVSQDGAIENTYTLVLMNKSQRDQDFYISTAGLDDATLLGRASIRVKGGELVRHPMSVSVPIGKISKNVTSFQFVIETEMSESLEQATTFIYF